MAALPRVPSRSASATASIWQRARRGGTQSATSRLGIEVHRPGIGHLLRTAAHGDVSNLRVIAHDAVEVLEQQIPQDSFDEVQLLFPDPWPKKRHHKRRLVQPFFIALVAAKLRRGGRLQIATDWAPYAEQMLVDLGTCDALINCSRDIDGAPSARAATRFERRGKRLGHRVRELLFVRSASN